MLFWISLSCVAVSVAFLILVIIFKVSIKHNGCSNCLVGKTVIVTGANSGIGFYTAQDFAKRGARVILGCRNREAAEEAKSKIVENTGNSNVLVELIDFASLTSVRNFAKRIKANENCLHILVNNAGAMIFKDSTTEDGLSQSMQVNYLGPFLLTMLLIDLLRKTESSRIVNVSSVMASFAQLKPNNLNYFDNSSKAKLISRNYANTKFAIILWTNELARRLKGTGITANSLHPGSIRTNIMRNSSVGSTSQIFTGPWLKSSEEGAQTTIYVSLSNDLKNVSGKYFDNCTIANPPKQTLDVALGKKVWEDSEDLIKLTGQERVL